MGSNEGEELGYTSLCLPSLSLFLSVICCGQLRIESVCGMWYGWCGLLIYLQLSSVEQQTASRAVCMCIQERNVRRLSFFLFPPVCCTILPTYLFVLVVVSPSHLVTYHYCCTVLCVNSARFYFSVNIQYCIAGHAMFSRSEFARVGVVGVASKHCSRTQLYNTIAAWMHGCRKR